MNLDTKSTVANAIFSANEMNKSASATQVKRFQDANTSFAMAMKKSSQNQEQQETVEKTPNSAEVQEKSQSREKNNVSKNKTAEEKHKTEEAVNNEISCENGIQDNIQTNTAENSNCCQEQNGYTPLTAQIQSYMHANGADIHFTNINPMSATSQAQISGMITTVDYSAVQMSDTDAKFFADLVTKTDMTAAGIAAEFDKAMQNSNIKMVQSTAKASAALIEALKESAKNHQAFRVDFDKDISVILQVDKGGKINANFIPGDKAVEAYLRNNIEFLRQRFTEENIAYGELSYSQSRRNKEEKERNNKENAHE